MGIKRVSSKQLGAISIFDRFGRLGKQISTKGKGWDGTCNNQLMDSIDYWFVLEYTGGTNDKTFKPHFTLKR